MSKKLILLAFLVLSLGLTFGLTYDRKASATVPYTNSIIDLDSGGNQANWLVSGIGRPVDVSDNGRFVAFTTWASNLVAGDTNSRTDAFVKDMQTGTVTRVSVSSSGAQSSSNVYDYVSISADGRYVVFASDDNSTFAPIYFLNHPHLFVHDMQTGATSLVSNPSSKIIPKDFKISGNGRYIVYLEDADGVVSGDYNHAKDVYIKDLQANTLSLVSKNSSGTVSNQGANQPSISYDGSEITFNSFSDNLVSGDTNGHNDVFLVNRTSGTISDITLSGDGDSYSQSTSLSADGSTIILTSKASNFVSGDYSNNDLMAYNVQGNAFQIVGMNNAGAHSQHFDSANYSVSADGSLVTFDSALDYLTPGDTNGVVDVFLRDLVAGTTERVSMRNASTQATSASTVSIISADGKAVYYVSGDTGLVPGDANGYADVIRSSTGSSGCSI